MNHLALGAAFPFLIGLIVYAARRFRASFAMLVLGPFFMVASATWAVIPDLPRIVGWSSMDQRMASTNRWIDVFFWHYTINCHETDSPVYAVAFVAMVAGVFFAAWRELSLAEKGRR
ncbi:hypothetical protein ACFLSJ_04015 [Verrucomicrobiota bacterium]